MRTSALCLDTCPIGHLMCSLHVRESLRKGDFPSPEGSKVKRELTKPLMTDDGVSATEW